MCLLPDLFMHHHSNISTPLFYDNEGAFLIYQGSIWRITG